MACKKKKARKRGCGVSTPSICLKYEGSIPENSPLYSEDPCDHISVEEVLDDLYSMYSDVSSDALEKTLTEDEFYSKGDELLDVIESLKKVMTKEEEVEGDTINFDDLDLSGIASTCDKSISNLTELLNYLIKKSVECNE